MEWIWLLILAVMPPESIDECFTFDDYSYCVSDFSEEYIEIESDDYIEFVTEYEEYEEYEYEEYEIEYNEEGYNYGE